ncbi:MAG: Rap1a/Tai family immunity protein [Hyphomicrobium sp.]
MAFTKARIGTIAALAAATSLALPSASIQAADEAIVLIELCKAYKAVPVPADGQFSQDYIRLKSSCAGVLNAHMRLARPDSGYCKPREVSMDTLTDIYVAWADRNTTRWTEPRHVTVDAAFAEAYPCPAKDAK